MREAVRERAPKPATGGVRVAAAVGATGQLAQRLCLRSGLAPPAPRDVEGRAQLEALGLLLVRLAQRAHRNLLELGLCRGPGPSRRRLLDAHRLQRVQVTFGLGRLRLRGQYACFLRGECELPLLLRLERRHADGRLASLLSRVKLDKRQPLRQRRDLRVGLLALGTLRGMLPVHLAPRLTHLRAVAELEAFLDAAVLARGLCGREASGEAGHRRAARPAWQERAGRRPQGGKSNAAGMREEGAATVPRCVRGPRSARPTPAHARPSEAFRTGISYGPARARRPPLASLARPTPAFA